MSGTQKRIKLNENDESESESDEKTENHGYERLQDESCRTVDVIVHCDESDNQCNYTEQLDNYNTSNNINDSDHNVEKSENKKLKISLSQEQIKNICVSSEKISFLELPNRKGRSASFGAFDKTLLPRSFRNKPRHSLGKIPNIITTEAEVITVESNSDSNIRSGCELNVIEKLESVQVPLNKTDQVIYDVPRHKNPLFLIPERKISNLTLSYAIPSKSLM